MIEHLGNCHGEWQLLLQGLPFIGLAFAAVFKFFHRSHKGCCGEDHKECCDCKKEGE